MPKQIAEWNTELKFWINSKTDLLSEHWEPFLETWPKSGMTQNGKAFELPTLEQRTKDSESSSLPTPTVSDQFTGSLQSTQQKPGSLHSVTLAQVFLKPDLFPTPKARDSQPEGYEAGLRRASPQVGTIAKGLVENDERILLPTTRVSMANGPTRKEIKEGNPKARIEVEVMLFPTPTAVDYNTAARSEVDNNDPKHRLKVASEVIARDNIGWGRFEPAIRRWEQILGRPAPAPTKPDGKDNGHRLSSMFTEWLMGLPEGWITGLGLKRNDELKLAGNGVVPQQAELALRILLEDDNLLERIKR